MKKYLALLTVLAFTTLQSGWAGALGLKSISSPDGSIEISGQQASNETDFAPADDHRGSVVTRVRLGVNMDVTDDVRGRIEAVRACDPAGANVLYGNGKPETVANEEANIGIQNAYLDIDGLLGLDSFRVGRQYVGRPGDLIVYFGPLNDDILNVTALDSLSITKKWWKLDITGVTGKIVDNTGVPGVTDTNADVAGDQNVSWITLNSDTLIPDMKVPLEFGVYQYTNTGATAATNDNMTLAVYDLRAGYTLMDGAVNLGAEYAMNGGQRNGAGPGGSNVDNKGTALLFNAMYDDKEVGWGAHLKYADASGDDPTETNSTSKDSSFRDIASDFRFGEILSNSNRLATACPLGSGPGLDTGNFGCGLNVINIGGYYKLPVGNNKLTALADYYMVSVNEVANSIDDGVGTEIDLTLQYAHSKDVTGAIGYATFSPDKGFINQYAANANLSDDPVTKLFAKLMVKWGGQ
ncbi:MAG TPA: hypothetical protein P5079_06405 [Elusimicrobiota bacterium]|nr:hypothetical protein [Elusimicrobiota bacterium]